MKQGNIYPTIYFCNYTAISRFELDKFNNYRNTTISFTGYLQCSTHLDLRLHQTGTWFHQTSLPSSVVSSPRLFPMQCINPILDPKMVIPTLFFSSIPKAHKCTQLMQLFHRNSRSWDITAKHTLERIQTNATSATILQSHNPTHAHPQCTMSPLSTRMLL